MTTYFQKPNRPYFTHEQTGQPAIIHFNDEGQSKGRPKQLAAHYMGHKLLVPGGDEAERRANTEVYLFMPETGKEMTIMLSEVETVWPVRNDKREAQRAAARILPDGTTAPARKRGTSRPIDVKNAIPNLDLSKLDLSAFGR